MRDSDNVLSDAQQRAIDNQLLRELRNKPVIRRKPAPAQSWRAYTDRRHTQRHPLPPEEELRRDVALLRELMGR